MPRDSFRQHIAPGLKSELPGQAGAEHLAADSYLSRLSLACDWVVYSPEFFVEAKTERVALIVYQKFPAADWTAAEFSCQLVRLANGERMELELAGQATKL